MSKQTIVTHSGSFHPDDVFAVASLEIMLEAQGDIYEVRRSRDPEVIAVADIVVDVGAVHDVSKKRFDHHQHGGAGQRENSIPYAAFGLVWKEYGETIAGTEAAAKYIDEKFVQALDAVDNGVEISSPIVPGVYPYTVGSVVFSFAPTWKDGEGLRDIRFGEAVEFAKSLLRREIVRVQDKFEGEKIVEEIYNKTEDKRLIILDREYPWGDLMISKAEPLFVVFPQRNRWHVKGVKVESHSFKLRKDLPESWAGKQTEELAKINGVSDSFFCHNKRFLAVAESKEGAIKMAQIALES